MNLCPKCAGEVRDGWQVCPACAARLDAETQTVFAPASSSTSADEGRFPAGTVLAGRYRILGLIGQGGMGEVYRAYDLILNQAVALKFLAGRQMSEAALARFRNEVRVARQVSHPNVCRVYDIGFVEGLHFLSMEYLDGEDLGSLLRRIGRLPQDKAIEFSRKICAGLSAAHERGVLHRDLKPSNIMIDGRGQVRITDFGLAAIAEEIALDDIRSGTPAYMSPEQRAGKEVTTRSDLYSLGLVLHEMFTGKRSSDTSPTELVKDLDPAIERVILRCLDEDAKRRPSSALNVAMALPGGDPIAAALAAGETPSPEMVAASQEKEGFRPRTAVLCFAGVLLLLTTYALLYPVTSLLRSAPLNIPPDGLAFRAQDVLRQLGYSQAPRHISYGFDSGATNLLPFLLKYSSSRRAAILASEQPAFIRFWYRQHQDEIKADSFLLPNLSNGVITFESPANTEPGMIRLALDPKGRLIALEARPETGVRGQGSARTPDWNAIFTLAGLNIDRFTPAAPQRIPPVPVDTSVAWTGTYEKDRLEQVRLEAGSWAGRVVYLDITGDWEGSPAPARPAAAQIARVVSFVVVLLGAAAVALRNLELGRGDRNGAARIATAVFLLLMAAWALTAAHVASYWELHLLVAALSWALFGGAVVWASYLAVEPYVRRYWPDALISWTRLSSGRIRDPLVACHVMVGVLVFMAVASVVAPWTYFAGGGSGNPLTLEALPSGSDFIAVLLSGMAQSVFITVGMLVVVVVLRLLTRNVWIADLVMCILVGAGAGGIAVSGSRLYAALAVAFLVGAYLALWLLRRHGLLATLAYTSMYPLIVGTPIDFTSWTAGHSLAALLIPAGVSAWALWVILSAHRRTETSSAG